MTHARGGPRSAARLLPLLLALAAACGREGGGDASTPQAAKEGGAPERGGTAVSVELHDLERPLSILYQSDLDSDLVDVMYMGLTRGAWRDGRMVFLTSNDSPMALAWHWEYAGADSAALRYRMKSGLRWSDGRPITAQDVAWTFRAAMDPETASPRSEELAQIDSVVAENDSVVVFHFARRNPDMLFATSLPIAPRHAFGGATGAALARHASFSRPESLVVSGAFKIGEWRAGQQITLVPNPHFPVRPLLDRLVVRILPEPTTRLVELRTGNADLVKAISFDAVPELRRRAPNLRFGAIEKRYWEWIAYNPRRGPGFDDPRVRRALGMALDVPGMIRALGMEGFATPAAGPYPPIFRDLYDPRAMPPLAYDPEGAKRLLETAGWRDADGDGVRERDGKALRFVLLTNTGNQRRTDVAQVLERQWRAVGAAMELRQLEFNTIQDRQQSRDFEAMLGSWGVNLSPDVSALFTAGSPFNIVSYDDTAAARLMREAQAAPTKARADSLWKAAVARAVRDQPYTWLFHYDVVVGMSDRLRGARIDTFGAYQNTWEWWIPADRRGAESGGGATETAADTSKDTRR